VRVSESTVSHVLNGTKFVSAAVRDRVLAAVRVMNYHRDSHARRLASGHSDFLGLIISDIENPLFPGLIKGFETAALAAGFEVLLCATHYDADRTANAFRKMIENKSPGVAVMTSRVDPEMARRLADHGVASVFLDADGPGPLKSNIRVDYRAGAGEAVRYLHNLGHRGFAMVAGPQGRASHRAYRSAVEATLAPLGLTVRVIKGDNDAAGGEAAVRGLLTAGRFPTAILCSNDLTAMSATRALIKCGMRVPEDVSVVGADDIPFAALTQPPLTTVRMPRERLGTLALETLRATINAPTGRGTEVVVETDLVIRESAGPAPTRPSPPPPPFRTRKA
jgi:DNA-binding LacI/PurR family transcriptional regulator